MLAQDRSQQSFFAVYGASSLQVWQAVGREAFLDNPEQLMGRIYDFLDYKGSIHKFISEEEFQQKYPHAAFAWDKNMTYAEAEYLQQRKEQEYANQVLMQSGSGSMGERVGSVITAVGASLLSPTNLLLSLIPIGGEARWMQLAQRIGKLPAVLAKGATSEAVFQLGMEPLIQTARILDQSTPDDATTIAKHVGIGALLGAGLHGLGYGISKIKRSKLSSPDERSFIPNERDLLIGAEQIAQGKHLDIENPTAAKSMMTSDRMETMPPHSLEQQYQDLLANLKTIYPDKEINLSKLGAQSQEALEKAIHKLQSGNLAAVEELLTRVETSSLTATPKVFTDQVRAVAASMEGSSSPNDTLLSFSGDLQSLCKEYKKASLLAKRNYVLNMQRFATAKAQVNAYGSATVGLKNLLSKANLRQMTVANSLRNNLFLELEQGQLIEAFKSKIYEGDIARELHALNQGGSEVGNSGSAKALEIAKIIHKWQHQAVNRANLAGAHIELLPGYITKQMHDPKVIRQMGFAKWKNFITPLLDHDKTGNIDLTSVYEALATGKHLYHLDEYMYVPHITEFGSITKSLNAARKLHFKDADSWLKYNQACGVYGLKDSVLSQLEKIGHSIGLLETLGTRPHDFLHNLKQDLALQLRKLAAQGNDHALTELQKLNANFGVKELDLMCGYNAPDSSRLAAIGSNVRAFKAMSALGKVVLSCFPDMATFAVEQQRNGIPLLQSYGNTLKALLHSFSSSEKKSFVKMLGLASDNLLGSAYQKLHHDALLPGIITKMTNVFFKLNCLEWWDNSFKSTMGLTLSQHLCDHAHLPFTQLPKTLQNVLTPYGIHAPQWELMKHCKVTLRDTSGGNTSGADSSFISPEKAQNLPKSSISNLLKEMGQPVNDENIRMAKTNLESAIRGYLLDRVDISCPTPHAAERALVNFGTKPGTPLGEFVRFFMQFKTFPITFMQKPLKSITVEGLPMAERTGRPLDVAKALSNPHSLLLMSQLLMGSTVLGYLSLCANKFLKDEKIPDAADPKVWQAAMLKGGGLGFYGDFLFGEYSRYGRSLTTEMAGPVLAEGDAILKLYNHAKDGKWSKAEDETFKFIKRNIPGRNLFYLEPILALFSG